MTLESINTALIRTMEYMHYRDGWNGDKSIAPVKKAIGEARDIIFRYHRFICDSEMEEECAQVIVFPLMEGGINIVFTKGDIETEITLYNSTKLTDFLTKKPVYRNNKREYFTDLHEDIIPLLHPELEDKP